MPENKQNNIQPEVLSNFVNRIANLPAVVTVLDTAKQSYNHVKDRNGLIGYTLTSAEWTAHFAVDHTLPVFEKVAAGPIHYVDNLACKGLDKVEQAYPGLTKNQPKTILQDAAAYGLSKYDDGVNLLRNYTSEAVNVLVHPRQAITTAYENCTKQVKAYTLSVLAATEEKLNKELSSLGVKAESAKYEGLELINRVAAIQGKVRDYVSNKAQIQYRAFQEYTSKSATELHQALTILQKMKDGILDKDKSLKDILDDLQVNSNWLKALLNDPDPGTLKTLPGKVILVTQNATSHVVALVTERSKLARSILDTYTKLSPELTKRLAPIAHHVAGAVNQIYTNLGYVAANCRRTIDTILANVSQLVGNGPKEPAVKDKEPTDDEYESSSTDTESD